MTSAFSISLLYHVIQLKFSIKNVQAKDGMKVIHHKIKYIYIYPSMSIPWQSSIN